MSTSRTTAENDDTTELRGWITGRLPQDWFTGPPVVVVDREEVTIVGELGTSTSAADLGATEKAALVQGSVAAFRERTREDRIAIARDLEHRGGRKVAWGVEVDGERWLFTHLAAPVMTRLRQPERQVLDTLVASGVARSRADALAWCVRLVGQHSDDWLVQLREAMADVERVRASGPDR